jgi:hypothetical protein
VNDMVGGTDLRGVSVFIFSLIKLVTASLEGSPREVNCPSAS